MATGFRAIARDDGKQTFHLFARISGEWMPLPLPHGDGALRTYCGEPLWKGYSPIYLQTVGSTAYCQSLVGEDYRLFELVKDGRGLAWKYCHPKEMGGCFRLEQQFGQTFGHFAFGPSESRLLLRNNDTWGVILRPDSEFSLKALVYCPAGKLACFGECYAGDSNVSFIPPNGPESWAPTTTWGSYTYDLVAGEAGVFVLVDGRVRELVVRDGAVSAFGYPNPDLSSDGTTATLKSAGGEVFLQYSNAKCFRIAPSTHTWEALGVDGAGSDIREVTVMPDRVYGLQNVDGRSVLFAHSRSEWSPPAIFRFVSSSESVLAYQLSSDGCKLSTLTHETRDDGSVVIRTNEVDLDL
jgi:hypothetical protein